MIYWTTERIIFKIDIFRKHTIRQWWQSLLFVSFSSQKIVLTTNTNVKNWQCCINRGQGKLTCFLYFLWPPLEAGLSISTFCFLFKHGRKLFFHIWHVPSDLLIMIINYIYTVRPYNFLQTVQKTISTKIAFAVTINKAQGQTFKRAVIYAPYPVVFLWPALCGIFCILFIWQRCCYNYWRASTTYRAWEIDNINYFISRNLLNFQILIYI